MKNIILSWQTPEYLPKDRSSDWFWAVGIISMAIIITAILLNNLLLAVFLSFTTLTIFIYAKRKPEIISIEITENGVRAGRNMHPFSLLTKFCVNENYIIPHLLLKSSSVINPLIVLPITKTDPEKVREVLRNYLIEEEIEEPLSQKLLEYLGF